MSEKILDAKFSHHNQQKVLMNIKCSSSEIEEEGQTPRMRMNDGEMCFEYYFRESPFLVLVCIASILLYHVDTNQFTSTAILQQTNVVRRLHRSSVNLKNIPDGSYHGLLNLD